MALMEGGEGMQNGLKTTKVIGLLLTIHADVMSLEKGPLPL